MQIFILVLIIKCGFGLRFDSLVNNYRTTEYYHYSQQDITNSTWKEVVVADRLINLIKCIPAHIDLDSELDLLVLDSETRLYWVSNIRGTSGMFSHQFVSKSKLLDFVIQGDAKARDKFFILGISSSAKKILKFNSAEVLLNNSISWVEEEIFDLESNDLGIGFADYQITGMHLYPVSDIKQYLFISVKNYYNSVSVIKIVIENQKLQTFALILMKEDSMILGAFDMNNDGLVDLVYCDNYQNVSFDLN